VVKIFISHRREDQGYAARSINDALRFRFGEENVYFDLDSMKAGFDWRVQIEQMVSECDVMLVIIGDHWLQPDASGHSRLNNEGDLVSFEVSSALNRDIPVIPVLVGNATIPDKEILPDNVKPLFYRQAVEVRASANFTPQIERLIASIAAVIPESSEPERSMPEKPVTEPSARGSRTLPGQLLWVILTLIVIGASWMAWDKLRDGGVKDDQFSQPISQPITQPTTKIDQQDPEQPSPGVDTPPPDTTPPVLTYRGPNLDFPQPLGSIELMGTVTDDAAVEVYVNGKAATVTDETWTYDFDVTIDAREIKIEATDAIGNKGAPLVLSITPSPSLFLDTLPARTAAAMWIENPAEFIRNANRSPFGTLFDKAWTGLSSQWENEISQNRNLPGIGRAPRMDDLFDTLEDEILVSLGFPNGSSKEPSFLIQASLAHNLGKFQQHLNDLIAELGGGNQLTGSRKSSPSTGTEYVFASEEFRFSIFVNGTNLFASLDGDLAENAARNFGRQNSGSNTKRMSNLLLKQRIADSSMVILANTDESFALMEHLSGNRLSPWANLLGAHGGVVDLGLNIASDGLFVQIGFPAVVSSSGFLSLLQADPFDPEFLPEVPGEADFYVSVAGNLEKGVRELVKFLDEKDGGANSRRELERLAGPNRPLNSLLAAMGNRVHIYGAPQTKAHGDIKFGATLNLANQNLIESWLGESFAAMNLAQSTSASNTEVWDVTRGRLIYGYDRWVREVSRVLNSEQTRPRVELAGLPPGVQAVAYAGSRSVNMVFSDLERSGGIIPGRLGAVLAHAKWIEGRYMINMEMRWD